MTENLEQVKAATNLAENSSGSGLEKLAKQLDAMPKEELVTFMHEMIAVNKMDKQANPAVPELTLDEVSDTINNVDYTNLGLHREAQSGLMLWVEMGLELPTGAPIYLRDFASRSDGTFADDRKFFPGTGDFRTRHVQTPSYIADLTHTPEGLFQKDRTLITYRFRSGETRETEFQKTVLTHEEQTCPDGKALQADVSTGKDGPIAKMKMESKGKAPEYDMKETFSGAFTDNFCQDTK